ncbi:MAG: NUDIX domain-containing protein [bacterium]
MSARRRVEVSAGVIERGGRILIAQRRPGDHLALNWEFPGGKRKHGESWEDCLRRELLEEIGVEVAVGAWLDAVTHAYDDRDVHLRFFRCRITRGTPASLDCHDVRWVAPCELANFEFPEADAALVRWLSASRTQTSVPASLTIEPRGGESAAVAEAVDVRWGTQLDEAMARCGVRSRMGCGAGLCGACAVDVVAGAANLTPPTAEERAWFAPDAASTTRPSDPRDPRTASEVARVGRRLACQARITGNIVLALKERSLLHF